MEKPFQAIVRLFRPYQWSKNLFVFAPLVFGKELFYGKAFLNAFAGFALFCLASSTVYVLNDVMDAEADRLHPRKKHRPIASGSVSVAFALVMAAVLGAGTLGMSFWLRPSFGAVVVGYMFLNIAYSAKLKHVVIVDVLVIAAGFVLRILGGSEVLDIHLSDWLVICTILLSLFLGFSKRRYEVVLLNKNDHGHRKVLEHYNAYFLDQMISVVTASTVTAYMLYTTSEETVRYFGTGNLIWTVPFVLYGIFRYLYLVYHKEEGGDPSKVVLADLPFMANVLLWLTTCVLIIYIL